MDWQLIATVVTSLLAPAYGYLFFGVVRDQKALEKRIAAHELSTSVKFEAIPDKYVRRDDLSEWKSQVLQTLSRIEEKLDGKVDRP